MATALLPERFALPQPSREAGDTGRRATLTKLLDKLDALEDEGKQARAKWRPDDTIETCLDLFNGEQKPPGGKTPHFKADIIEAFLDRQVADLTDTRPILRVEPRKVGLASLAKILQAGIRTVWDESAMQRQTYKAALSAGVLGSAGTYTGYDATQDEIYIETLRLQQVGFDPAVAEAALLDQEAEYFVIERVRPCAELALRFPGPGGTVSADVSVLDDDDTQQKRLTLGPLTGIINRRFGRNGREAAETLAVPRAKVREFFVKDRTTDPEGTRLFPTYRQILCTRDVILVDRPLVYWDGVMPVDWYDWAVRTEHPWGRSEPEILRYIQGAYNALIDGLVENQLLTNFVQFIAEHDAVDEKTWQLFRQIKNALIIKKKSRNATVGLTLPQPFGADKIGLAKFLFTIGQLLTGVTDVTLGEHPGSVQSGAAIEGLQEGASLMNRSRQSRLEDLYTRVGQKLVSRILQFWPSDRFLALVGPTIAAQEAASQRAEFFVKDDGTPLSLAEKQEALRYLRFSVLPGSSRPGARQNRTKMMLELYDRGLVSGIDVLEAAEIPDAETVFARGQAEMAAKAPPPPGTK